MMLSLQLFCTSILFLLSLFIPPHGQAAVNNTTLAAVSLGEGRIALFWPPSPLFYTGGGWQLQDMKSGKIVARWGKNSLEKGLATLPTEQRQKLQPLFKELKNKKTKDEQSSLTGLLLMSGMTDFDTARRLGMGCLLTDVDRGARRYQLVLIDTHQKQHRPKQLRSPAVDGYQATSPPAPALNPHGISVQNSVELYWHQPQQNENIPTPLARISRTGEDGKPVELTGEAIWINTNRDLDKPAFVDTAAPLEAQLTYTIQRMDIFGRLSEPVTVTVLNQDADALRPPTKITAEADELRVKLHWQPGDNPYTSGYVIERSRRANGIYEVLTPKGLARDTDSYTDKTVQGGFVYYYRVRAMGPRGDVGPAPDPVSAMVMTDGSPDRPDELKARVEPTRVILSWQAMPLPVAGYIVEKRKKGDDTWVRINSRLATRPQLEDPVNLGDYGQYQYRVTAVAFGNAQSRPSKTITVTLTGHALVPSPHLADITSEEGKVHLRFSAGKPVQRTDKMLLVRGIGIRDMGLVIARDIDGDDTEYTDSMVRPGEDYWYALIARDEEGHRSEMSNKLFIHAAPPEIPRPDRPDVELTEKPFRRIVITFDQPEGFLRAAIMRKVGDGPWTTIARDISGTDTAIDADPPESGRVAYRLAYLDEHNDWGQPSKEAILTLQNK